MSSLKIIPVNQMLLLITAVAAWMRIPGFSEWTLTNDELSALLGMQYSSYGESIRGYVMEDMHPAGVHTFLWYWTRLAGISVFWLRLPFVLAGVASVPLLFWVGKKFQSAETGLMAASILAVLQTHILYSQLIRPYGAGVFCLLLLALIWYRVLLDEKPPKYYHAVLLGMAFALCMYMHYFCFMVAGFIGLFGFRVMRARRSRFLLVGGILSVVLFLPHWSVTQKQFSVGGLESWLARPDMHFFDDYFRYLFNSRLLWMLLVLGIVVYAYSLSAFYMRNKRLWMMSFLVFVLPLFIGYYYSVYVNPVLQYSILLFGVPFFLLFLSGGASAFTEQRLGAVVFVILFSGITVVKAWNRYNPEEEFGSFKQPATLLLKDAERYGKDNLSWACNVTHPFYIHYYLNQPGIFKPALMYSVLHGRTINELRNRLAAEQTEYFVYLWTNSDHPAEIPDVIRSFYPYCIAHTWLFNCEYYLFSKKPGTESLKPYRDLSWSTKSSYWHGSYSDSLGQHYERMHPGKEYSSTLEIPVSELVHSSSDQVCAAVDLFGFDQNEAGVLAISVEDSSGSIQWESAKAVDFRSDRDWFTVHFGISLPLLRTGRERVKIYFTNEGARSDFLLRNFRVSVWQGNPILYGPRKDEHLLVP